MKGVERNRETEEIKEYIGEVLNLVRNCTGTYDELEQTDIIVKFLRLPRNLPKNLAIIREIAKLNGC